MPADEPSFLPPWLRKLMVNTMTTLSNFEFGDIMHVTTYFGYLLTLFCAYVLIFGLIVPFIKAIFLIRTPDSPSEDIFEDPNKPLTSQSQHQATGLNDRMYAVGDFPSLLEEATLSLSVIVPAYNEDVRLPTMLDEAFHFLEQKAERDRSFTYEIIVVDDGSRDSTCSVVLTQYCTRYGTNKIRLLRLHCNHGKGGAVRKGMFKARGALLLMVDADGATQFSDLDRLTSQLRTTTSSGSPLGVAIGSRHHMQADAVAKRSCFRNILMYGFNYYVSILCVPGIKDTQCGFKLFTRAAARLLFPVQHIERWAFDVELLHLCARLNIPVTEVPVTWVEMSGSKVNLFEDIPQMARDIFIIRLCYTLGIWKANSTGSFLYNGGSQQYMKNR
jgi:dolichyl-phosphate beta-glucosyltransferase